MFRYSPPTVRGARVKFALIFSKQGCWKAKVDFRCSAAWLKAVWSLSQVVQTGDDGATEQPAFRRAHELAELGCMYFVSSISACGLFFLPTTM